MFQQWRPIKAVLSTGSERVTSSYPARSGRHGTIVSGGELKCVFWGSVGVVSGHIRFTHIRFSSATRRTMAAACSQWWGSYLSQNELQRMNRSRIPWAFGQLAASYL